MKGYWLGMMSWCCCWASWSQGQNIEWGTAYERSSLFNQQQIVQVAEEGIYVWQYYKDPQYYFKHKALYYDNQGNKIASEAPIQLDYQGQAGAYQASHFVGEQWQLYYTVPQPKAEKELLCQVQLNPQTLALETNPQVITTIPYNKAKGGSAYRLGQSLQEQTLLYGVLPQAKKKAAQLSLHLLNQEGTALQSRQITVPQEAGLLSIEDVQEAFLTSTGTVYLLCKFYHNKARKEEKKLGMPYHFALLTVHEQGEVTWKDSLSILSPEDSAWVVSAHLYEHQGAIYCVGTYKKPISGGFFQWSMATTEQVLTLDYPTRLWQEEQQQKSKKVGLQNHRIKQWLPQADGSYLAIAEQHYIKVYWDKSEGQQTLHHLKDILLVKWDEEGQLLWYHNIDKHQKGGGEGYTSMKETWYSFAALQKEGQVHVFYNELPDNDPEELKLGYYNQPKALDCWHYQINEENGELIKAQPLEVEKEWLLYPQKIQLLPNGQVLLVALKRATSAKEKALLRWGYYALDATK